MSCNNTSVKNFQDQTIAVTPVCDTSAYAIGDVLFPTTAVVFNANTGAGPLKGRIASITIIDKDDQTAAGMDLYFFKSNVALGTANSAPSITDTNAEEIVGRVRLSPGDWTDLGGVKYADAHNLNFPFKLASGATVYVGAVTQGTPTQTASGIVLRVSAEIQEGNS